MRATDKKSEPRPRCSPAWMTALAAGIVLLLASHAAADRIDSAIRMLDAPVFKVRAQACLALGVQTGQAARIVGPLTRALEDSHEAVRAAAAIALGKVLAVEAAPGLSAAANDEDPAVARMAQRSLDAVMAAWSRSRDFGSHRFAIGIAGLSAELAFKDLLVQRLLEYSNVEVGAVATFGEEAAPELPAVELELRGSLEAVDASTAHLTLTLAFGKGDYTLKTWSRSVVRGKTRAELMSNAAALAVRQVVGFLGEKGR